MQAESPNMDHSLYEMNHQKILYISQEINPYLPSTPLSLFGRNLPQDIQSHGYEVRTFMPKYGSINERRNQLHEVIRLSGMNISIDDNDHPLIIKVATLQPTRMQVYFIDNDDYFEGPGTKILETVSSPEDNDERSMFFVRGVIETVRKLRWDPTVIHCTGWIAALAPLYIRHLYQDDPGLSKSVVVYSLRPESFEGTLDSRLLEKLKLAGFTDDCLQSLGTGDFDWLSINKLGIDHSDAVVVTTPDIPAELLDYARKSGKPVLEYPGPDGEESTTAAYHDFYQSLLAKKDDDTKLSDKN